MPRQAIINPHVLFEGFTACNLTKEKLRNLSVESWTHFYHKPYECDWAEARKKAKERRWRSEES